MSPDVPSETLVLSTYVEDIGNTVEFLKDTFKKDKISLLGHSFGGGLGYLYLLAHQDNIDKFVSLLAVINIIIAATKFIPCTYPVSLLVFAYARRTLARISVPLLC